MSLKRLGSPGALLPLLVEVGAPGLPPIKEPILGGATKDTLVAGGVQPAKGGKKGV